MERRIRIKLEIDRDGLIDDYFAYVTDPRPTRNEHHADLLDDGPVSPEVLEHMVLDGVDRREDIASLVDFVVESINLSSPILRYRWAQ